jgi:hypothetical protein
MGTVVKDLGAVSAYAYAVEQGYTGTEEEYAELMASYATVAEEAAASAEAAAGSATNAAASATQAGTAATNAASSATAAASSETNAQTAAGAAAQSRTDAAASATAAAGSASQASSSASGAASSASAASTSASDANVAKTAAVAAQGAAETAQGKAEDAQVAAEDAQTAAEAAAQGVQSGLDQIATNTSDISDLQTAMETKAEIDGYYEEMTVGDAEQLVATQYVEDSVPYLYRTTGGTADVGNREYVDKIVGGTVAWNQLFRGNNRNNVGVVYTRSNDFSEMTIKGTATQNSYNMLQNTVAGINGHVYFVDKDSDNADYWIYNDGKGVVVSSTRYGIGKATEDKNFYMRVANGTVIDITVKPQIIDLTTAFGTEIANYIYQLEQTTVGAGVAYFCKLFPKDYYEYNPGELLSVEGLSAHETVGFNQWDEEWEVGKISTTTGDNITGNTEIRSKNHIRVLPGNTYCAHIDNAPWMAVIAYDEEKRFVSNLGGINNNFTFTVPSNCHYVRFYTASTYGTTYKNDICINLSWSGTRNGEYLPYQKHSYPLDSSLILRGIPKLDAANNLYYDGDEYLPDGTVNRRYGVVDLGTLTWEKLPTTGSIYRFRAVLNVKGVLNTEKGNVISSKYPAITANASYSGSEVGIAVYSGNGYVFIYDPSYADAAAFKAAMSGVYLVYELATPTTETAEPYQEIQICDDWGTEEYVSTGMVPVGHETRYPANLRDKLQHLPNLADADGYYMINQSGSQMTLERFRIPKAPTTDGTYTLKATVSGGTPTYTWEAVE